MKKEEMLALKLHEEGYSCAEAVVKAANDCLELGLSDDAIRMSSGLGGGLGGSGCVCGALNGACLILGVVAGRSDVSEKSKPEIYKHIREFQECFTKEFGSTCCRVLKGPEIKVSCNDLIYKTTGMLTDFIAEKGLK